MKKVERRYTSSQIRALGEGMHCDGGGLYIRVSPTKDGAAFNRTWVFRYRLRDGRTREHGIGSLSTLSLSEARDKARLLRQVRLEGRDPIEERRATRIALPPEIMTFDQCAEAFISAKAGEWRVREGRGGSKEIWESSLANWVSPVIGKLNVALISTPHVLSVLNQPVPGEDGSYWIRRTKSASEVRNRIERILDWAHVAGYRPEEKNPARWRGHLSGVLPTPSRIRKIEHHKSLLFADVGSFIADLRSFDSKSAFPPLVEFIILTACRIDELLQATWDEIDFTAKAWTRPKEHMKGDRPHRIPLSPRAMEILERVAATRTSDLIFPGPLTGRKMGRSVPLQFVNNTMKRRDLTLHGFRASFKTWCEERTNFDSKLIEAVLAHKQSALEEAYHRGDLLEKRRRLMDAWAAYVSKPAPVAKPATDSNIVEMRIPA